MKTLILALVSIFMLVSCGAATDDGPDNLGGVEAVTIEPSTVSKDDRDTQFEVVIELAGVADGTEVARESAPDGSTLYLAGVFIDLGNDSYSLSYARKASIVEGGQLHLSDFERGWYNIVSPGTYEVGAVVTLETGEQLEGFGLAKLTVTE